MVLPLGIAHYLDITVLFEDTLAITNAVVVTIVALAGYFRLWRYSYLVTLVLFHLLYVARYSQGKISHGSHFVGIAVLAMASATLAMRGRKEIRRTVLGLCYFFFGASYTSAALSKLVSTGLHWPDGRHLWMWIQERHIDSFSLTGVADYSWVQLLALNHYAVATSILTLGLLTELFAFLMWFQCFRPAVITLLLGMHVGIRMVMQITFNANTYLLLVLAYPWGRFIEGGLRRFYPPQFDRIRRLGAKLE